ncbi:Rho GTPase activation protein [Martensiomyces pterosporus]|nr:Rho GTPase activation protein [Martensiomyces pterosporus]
MAINKDEAAVAQPDADGHDKHQQPEPINTKEGSAQGGGWFERMWCGIRRQRGSSNGTRSSARNSVAGLESGSVVVGSVRDPGMVIPADIMFSQQRAKLYGNMIKLLVKNPYYFSRIVSQIKYHECDALLSIILDSVFSGPVHEPSLTALFTEIIELEVDRTTSIDTVMRNDAPSVHMLSAYLKTPRCLDYLRIAVGPTIETIVALGTDSLDSDLASVYQDWIRTQTNKRLPPVVGAVEAAGYTEVQNLSRRRHRHLVYVATHCLHDIINARPHVPPGLLAICSSTLRATKRRFPHVDQAKAYSLVGGIFFLRFVNAALATPNQYGLLNASPCGQMKTNLKLVARLVQRLSNYSAKPPEEWPVDAKSFMKANVSRFHAFLASLTDNNGNAHARLSMDEYDEESEHQAAGLVPDAGWEPAASAPPANPSTNRLKPPPGVATAGHGAHALSISSLATPKNNSSHTVVSHVKSCHHPVPPPLPPKAAEITLIPTDSTNTTSSVITEATKAPATATASSNNPSRRGVWSNTNPQPSPEACRKSELKDRRRKRRSQGSFYDVVLPLNDLYLLQKYLELYEDSWAPGEPQHALQWMATDGSSSQAVVSMQACLAALGPAPSLLKASNNHKTRIPLV